MTTLARIAYFAALGLAACGWIDDAAAQQDPWPELAVQVFNGRPLADGTGPARDRDARPRRGRRDRAADPARHPAAR